MSKRILVAGLECEITKLGGLLTEAHEHLQHGSESTIAKRNLLARIRAALGGDGEAPSPVPQDRPRKKRIKYANPDDPSQVWNGCGRTPNWLKPKLAKGAALEAFAITRDAPLFANVETETAA